MTEVWIVRAGWEYDQNEILTVFSSKDRAEQFSKHLESAIEEGIFSYDFVQVEPFEVKS